MVEFVTEKHAHTFDKLQKLCIILTDQVATDLVKLSKFLRKAKIYNASSFFFKKMLQILRFVYTVLCSFYISSFVKFKVSFFFKKNMFLTHISNTNFPNLSNLLEWAEVKISRTLSFESPRVLHKIRSLMNTNQLVSLGTFRG